MFYQAHLQTRHRKDNESESHNFKNFHLQLITIHYGSCLNQTLACFSNLPRIIEAEEGQHQPYVAGC